MNPELLEALAARTEAEVVALTTRWRAGELSDGEFVALATAALERGQAGAYATADAALAAILGVGALGILPGRQEAAAARAVAEGIAERGVTVEAGMVWDVERLRREVKEPGHPREWYWSRNQAIKFVEQAATDSRAEVLRAGQEANGEVIRVRRTVWRRRLNAGACQICRDLAAKGDAPPSVRMYQHKGCACTQAPVQEGEVA